MSHISASEHNITYVLRLICPTFICMQLSPSPFIESVFPHFTTFSFMPKKESKLSENECKLKET